MATDSVHPEGIRLQAERVCRAYRTLRASAHSADFTSAEFPVGLFAELFQQIKQLDVWLEPSEPADKVANRIAAVRDLTADEARDGLHAETVREICEENPEADDREVKLRVAIRESMCMTRDEEDAAYERIAAAIQGGAA